MEQEIIEGNKLIAEFMGIKWEASEGVSNVSKITYGKIFNTEDECRTFCDEVNRYKTLHENYAFPYPAIGGMKRELKYHTSWDWLMPCLKKAKDEMPNRFWSKIFRSLQELEISITWQEFVDFLKWYNQNKK